MGLLGTVRGWWGARQFNKTALGIALQDHTRKYFYSDHSLSWFKQENKDALIADFYGKIGQVACAPDPFLALRESLTEYVLAYAQVTILSHTRAEKIEMPWADNPYISGTIHQHVVEASEFCDEVQRHKDDLADATAEDLIAFANTRGAVNLYYANGLNMLRIDMGDQEEPDWFRAFVEAMLVWEEDTYREKLGLPSLIGGTGGVVYSAFFNYVIGGEPRPFERFRTEFPDYYLAGHGPVAVPELR